MAKQRNARQWATLLRRYQRSGLTQAAFCSRHGIALSTLGYQLRKHRAGTAGAAEPAEAAEPADGPGSAPGLIELKLPSPVMAPPAAVRIEVLTAGGPAVSIHCHSAQVGEILTQLPNLQPTCA